MTTLCTLTLKKTKNVVSFHHVANLMKKGHLLDRWVEDSFHSFVEEEEDIHHSFVEEEEGNHLVENNHHSFVEEGVDIHLVEDNRLVVVAGNPLEVGSHLVEVEGEDSWDIGCCWVEVGRSHECRMLQDMSLYYKLKRKSKKATQLNRVIIKNAGCGEQAVKRHSV